MAANGNLWRKLNTPLERTPRVLRWFGITALRPIHFMSGIGMFMVATITVYAGPLFTPFSSGLVFLLWLVFGGSIAVLWALYQATGELLFEFQLRITDSDPMPKRPSLRRKGKKG